MGRPSKGERKTTNVRVPAEVHAQLLEIRKLTGVDITDQLAPLVIEYAKRTLPEARLTAQSLIPEAMLKTA